MTEAEQIAYLTAQLAKAEVELEQFRLSQGHQREVWRNAKRRSRGSPPDVHRNSEGSPPDMSTGSPPDVHRNEGTIGETYVLPVTSVSPEACNPVSQDRRTGAETKFPASTNGSQGTDRKRLTTFKQSDFEITEEMIRWATEDLVPVLTRLELHHHSEEFIEFWDDQPDKRSLPGWVRTWKNRMRALAQRKLARGYEPSVTRGTTTNSPSTGTALLMTRP